jgi:peptide/nickel transport system permease protein
MLRYIAKRFLSLILVMLLVATLVFFLTRLAPGDPAALMLGDQATAEDIARLREVYGLDQPVVVQFVLWLKEIARGNLGRSIFLQQSVGSALLDRAELTFFLALFAVSIAAAIGIPAGIASAVWRGR